jgi:hypothetical protein
MRSGTNAEDSATPPRDEAGRQSVFVTTRWSVVLTAGRRDTTRARAALESLCQTYWFPLYAYVRRRGHSPEDARDLTQEFFVRLLERTFRTSRRNGTSGSKVKSGVGYMGTELQGYMVGAWSVMHERVFNR